MKANTYVVKPFGISEVKVIALKGDPGTPSQEQVNTAVDEYMTEHPEAQIPDGSITEQKLSSDVVATLNDVDNKADKVGSYPDLIAGTAENLLSSSYQTDKTPYILRRTPYGARERGSIVGGSIVWNQLNKIIAISWSNYQGVTFTKISDTTIEASGETTGAANARIYGTPNIFPPNHVYLIDGFPSNIRVRIGNAPDKVSPALFKPTVSTESSVIGFIYAGTDFGTGVEMTPQVFDLTLMFGSTIADYIYAQEQATAGAGVALAKAWAGITADYSPYDAGSIKSVAGLTAHRMYGKNNFDGSKVTTTHPANWGVSFDGYNTLTVTRLGSYTTGAPTCPLSLLAGTYVVSYTATRDSSVSLYTDGTYTKAFSVTNYANNTFTVEDGKTYSLAFTADQNTPNVIKNLQIERGTLATTFAPYKEKSYPLDSSLTLRGLPKLDGDNFYYDGDVYKADGTVERRYGYRAYQSGDESDANVLTDGTNTVYKLATPTTEQAEPYTALQICDPAGTEEWVGASMPVGHDTKYYADLKGKIEDIPDAPSTNGTYVLKATVSSSGVTYEWIAG